MQRLARAALLVLAAAPLATSTLAFEFTGQRAIVLHVGDSSRSVVIGTVRFEGAGEAAHFAIDMDSRTMHDHFLSMKEFKCLEGRVELLCHVPYPYESPRTVRADDLRWLEHALLFFYKAPRDFGAKLWNGIYFRLRSQDGKLVGVPQAIDLNLIGVPPEDLSQPPYDDSLRSDIDPSAREFVRLTIE